MMTRKHFEWVADSIAPMVNSPLVIERIADELQEMNPRFNRDRFVDRAIKAWERNNLPQDIDDEVPYRNCCLSRMPGRWHSNIRATRTMGLS